MGTGEATPVAPHVLNRLLVANRGEVAIRIARAAAELGLSSTAVYAEDDRHAPHVAAADGAQPLGGSGPAAYLDAARLVRAAREAGCDAVHPGYGFLSESAAFARACEAAGLVFVGPAPATLELLGDKVAAKRLAVACGVPVLPGIDRPVSLAEAAAFLRDAAGGGAAMLKAVAGGGGRGMRVVTRDTLEADFRTCQAEARQAFGSGELYIEALLPRARHVEVQVVADAAGAVSHCWDRECSLQRHRQKLVEVAPAAGLDTGVRQHMLASAVAICRAAKLSGLATVEFLVDTRPGAEPPFVFLEVNPRLQVEHTVTEEVLGVDLVRAQLEIAGGATLAGLGLGQADIPMPRGAAIQTRILAERVDPDGGVRPSSGTITRYQAPAGPGIRVDDAAQAGLAANPRYDSLLAKLVVRAGTQDAARRRALRALGEFRIAGVETNLGFLRALLASDALTDSASLHTRFVEEHLPALAEAAAALAPCPAEPAGEAGLLPEADGSAAVPEGALAVRAPMTGMLAAILVRPGDRVASGQAVATLEAMKMEVTLSAPEGGIVRSVAREPGAIVAEGTLLLLLDPAEADDAREGAEASAPDPEWVRPDLARVHHLHHLTTDEGRAEAAARRRAGGKRTARENIADLCDPGSFAEYGPLVTAARQFGETDERIAARLGRTAADGIVVGVGRVNGALFGPDRSRCVAMSYDYTVLAGTQGGKGHAKTDRMFELAERSRLPVVFYTEGGGGRSVTAPGEAPPPPTTLGGLKVGTWRAQGRLSGHVPMVGIASGRCFAGNAFVLGLCDVIIATRDANIGVGGPAMIEGGGLGRFTPEEVGPVGVQEPNGVIDILAEDEADATGIARRYLAFYPGGVADWPTPDQRTLRHAVGENRRAGFDVRAIVATLGDEGSVLELRRRFAPGMLTALARVEGRPVGVIANNSSSPTGGAIDSDGADKAARFMQLCDAFGLPIVSLLDVPGNMVGPEAERTALVRHCARLYVTGANLSVPLFAVVLRKAYGLGALAMSGGSFDAPFFTVSWPTGEFAGMNLEGAVKLGHRARLEAVADPAERQALFERMVADAYAWAGAANGATVFEFDDVIDPADTRAWIAMGLGATANAPRAGGRRWIDTW